MSEPVDLLTETLFHYKPGELAGRLAYLDAEGGQLHEVNYDSGMDELPNSAISHLCLASIHTMM